MKRTPQISPLLTHAELLYTIGAKARQRRELLGLSRRELAAKSGVSEPTIARFELNGTATLSVMIKLARALNALDSFNSLFSTESYSSLDEFLHATS